MAPYDFGKRDMWEANITDVQGARRFRLSRAGSTLSFRELFELLESDLEFASWYTRLLADSGSEAFFWEHPPIAAQSYDDAAEFVLIDSPALAKLEADPEPFRSELQQPDRDVVAFRNLGGDALLLAPQPLGNQEAYPHLAAFLRYGPESQIQGLWQETGRAVRESLSDEPMWISTAGMGVSWLHIRLDSRPKYYRFRPYKSVPW